MLYSDPDTAATTKSLSSSELTLAVRPVRVTPRVGRSPSTCAERWLRLGVLTELSDCHQQSSGRTGQSRSSGAAVDIPASAGEETEYPRENPPTNAIVPHDSHMRPSRGLNPDRLGGRRAGDPVSHRGPWLRHPGFQFPKPPAAGNTDEAGLGTVEKGIVEVGEGWKGLVVGGEENDWRDCRVHRRSPRDGSNVFAYVYNQMYHIPQCKKPRVGSEHRTRQGEATLSVIPGHDMRT
ncbi:hypothetical protein PR048_007965 [Dryococelus australis]|uniref:Uncharacterized protein n=1 Tax=Dryococelus australis TaxID=614101 RepID=A0ABQ9HWN3_9NEOP|nr:hypothetical protein PR048_007965 [Dryococelus australis]